MDIILRNEEESDYRAVEEVTREAFWNLYVPGCDEHYLAHTLRKHADFIKELTFVVEYEGKIVGSIMYSKSWLTNEAGETLDTITFGPVCVAPANQHQGIGKQLIGHTMDLARSMGYPAIVILGDPANYVAHGFRNCKDFNVTMDGTHYPYGMLMFELKSDALVGHTWTYKYSDAYNVDRKKVAEFDAQFPTREKKVQPSQTLFAMACQAFLIDMKSPGAIEPE